jgi:glutamate synthase (NADPH/NADH) small chain
MRAFDSVVLCTGATQPRDLAIPGRELKGIHFAVDFLRGNTKSLLDSEHRDGKYVSAKGKDVVVIGGGDTGTDCVATAMRHGCRSLIQLEILPRPPMERAPDNPWPEWPRTYRADYGQEEAAAVFGCDPREFSVRTEQFLRDGDGHVAGLETTRLQWFKDGSGCFASRVVDGNARTHPAQLVLIAMGFLGPEGVLLDQLGVERDERSNVRTSVDSYATNVPGVFAAGDMRRGQSLVVWAISEGRAAARECDRFLMGRSALP